MIDLGFLHTLRFRITAAIVFVIAISASLIGVYTNRTTGRHLNAIHHRTGELLARHIALNSVLDVMTRDEERLQSLVTKLGHEPLARYAAIFDADGMLLAMWFERPEVVPPSGTIFGRENALSRHLVMDGEPLVEFQVPVLRSTLDQATYHRMLPPRLRGLALDADQPDEIGVVRIGISSAALVAQLERSATTTFAIVLISILCGGVATIILVRVSLRPITQLIQATHLIGRGDFDTVVGQLPGRGELGALSRALAQMARALRSMKHQLVGANVNLERKVSERTLELRAALDELKVLDRMKDEFLSSISHEFKTPLTSIRASAEILLQFPDEDPKTRNEFIDMILKESERLTRLVNDVLELVRIESGEVDWTLDEVDILELAENAIKALRPLLEEHRLRATVTRREPNTRLRGDRDRLFQVLNHLLSNAIKFSHEGGIIEVSARVEKDNVVTIVRDQGIGIEPADQRRIFDRFKQVGDTLTDKPGGTGLGLPICKNIVLRHGGDIWVESQANRGATFHVLLPIRGPNEADLMSQPSRSIASCGEPTTVTT